MSIGWRKIISTMTTLGGQAAVITNQDDETTSPSKEEEEIPTDVVVDWIVPYVSDSRVTCNSIGQVNKDIHNIISQRIDLPWPNNIKLKLCPDNNNAGVIISTAVSGRTGSEGYIAATDGELVAVWNCQTGKRSEFRSSYEVTKLLFSSAKPHTLYTCYCCSLSVWDLKTCPPSHKEHFTLIDYSCIRAIELSPCGELVYLDFYSTFVFPILSNGNIRCINGTAYGFRDSMACSNEWVVFGGGSNIRLQSLSSNVKYDRQIIRGQHVKQIEFVSLEGILGPSFVVLNDLGKVNYYTLQADNSKIQELEIMLEEFDVTAQKHITCLKVSPNGIFLVAGYVNGIVAKFRVKDGKYQCHCHSGFDDDAGILSLAFTDCSGQTIAATRASAGEIRFLNIRNN